MCKTKGVRKMKRNGLSEKEKISEIFPLRPAFIEEADFFHSKMDANGDLQAGMAGHGRMDFGHDGKMFWYMGGFP